MQRTVLFLAYGFFFSPSNWDLTDAFAAAKSCLENHFFVWPQSLPTLEQQ